MNTVYSFNFYWS